MRSASLLLLILAVGIVASGCSGGVSDSDKANTAVKFKKLNKNDVNHDATP